MGVNCFQMDSPFLNDRAYYCKMCKTEVPAHTLHGHIDGIITDPEGLEHLWEHKALSTYTFDSYEAGETIPHDYIMQCVLYHYALTRDLGKDLSYAILHIKNKNSSRYMEYYLSYDEQTDIVAVEINRVTYDEGIPKMEYVKEAFLEHVIKDIKLRMTEIDGYVARKVLPMRPYEPDSWQCGYCRYADYCVKEYEQEIQKRDDNVTLEPDTVTAIQKYMTEIRPERLRLAKEEDSIKESVKLEMVSKNGKSAIAAGYNVSLKGGSISRLDKTKIPPNIIEAATLSTPYEKLDIRLGKTDKPKATKKKERIIGTSGNITNKEA